MLNIFRACLLALMTCSAMLAYAGDDEIVERTIVIKNGRFYPDVVEVPANTKIRLIVVNEGPGPEEFESVVLGIESVSNAGVTRKVIVQPLKPGEYPFFGEFHMDTAQGKIVAK
ncbi:MAG: cupredoxin domain-containing protein [Pseudomonadales bacterium]|nr:cupredoxin domain-containing protein [Pseudomonadales bacterium]